MIVAIAVRRSSATGRPRTRRLSGQELPEARRGPDRTAALRRATSIDIAMISPRIMLRVLAQIGLGDDQRILDASSGSGPKTAGRGRGRA